MASTRCESPFPFLGDAKRRIYSDDSSVMGFFIPRPVSSSSCPQLHISFFVVVRLDPERRKGISTLTSKDLNLHLTQESARSRQTPD